VVQHIKWGKIYRKTIKYTKWTQNIPNDHKIDHMATNIPTFSIARPSKIYPNWTFGFENMPSGNPVVSQGAKRFFWKGFCLGRRFKMGYNCLGTVYGTFGGHARRIIISE
jgi:hypothetical protein